MKQYTLKTFEPKGNFKIDYESELNKEQHEVVTSAEGPCLVLAGAGSGKTRTLVYRVAYLLEKGIKPNRILLVTFTNKASKEMLSRVDSLVHGQTKGLWGGTFHHMGNRILRIYGKEVGIEPNFNILDSEDAKALIKTCRSSVPIPNDKFFPKVDLIYKIISLSVNLNQSLGQIISDRFSQISDSYIDSIKSIAELYQTKKKQVNALDFDDLLFQWNQLLTKSQNVKEKLASQFQYILVDEYQDTNPIQGEIVNNLAGVEENILVVGDDSQSIYSFRGADVNNILNFPKVFKNAKTYKLESNYRSTPEIIDLTNMSIANNQKQFDKKLHTNKPSGTKPALVTLDDNKQQAEFICQRILDLQRDEGIEINNIAILFRAHFMSLELEMELNKRGIVYIMRGGLRFFEQAHIKDVISYVRIVSNIRDEISWSRILQLQPGIGGANAKKIWERFINLTSLQEVISYPFQEELSARAYEGWQRTKGVLIKLSAIPINNISALLAVIINNDYDYYLRNNYDNYSDRLADLEQLMSFAASYEDLDKFLSDIALGEGFKGNVIADQKESPENGVTLSTIHQSKGLEWKVVFVIGMADGQFPNTRVFDRPLDMEEERRLFYVAATRAEDQLYFTYPMFSKIDVATSQLSQFIRELPNNLYEKWQVNEESYEDNVSDENTIYVDEDGEEDVTATFWQRIAQRRKDN